MIRHAIGDELPVNRASMLRHLGVSSTPAKRPEAGMMVAFS